MVSTSIHWMRCRAGERNEPDPTAPVSGSPKGKNSNNKNFIRNLIFMTKRIFLILFLFLHASSYAQKIVSYKLQTKEVQQYGLTELEIITTGKFKNPHDQREVTLDMVITSPSGKALILPCFYTTQRKDRAVWNARFSAQEYGTYQYYFRLKTGGNSHSSKASSFNSGASSKDGMLHTFDLWTLRFDSGKPFRGIGENVGWESRSFENKKWTYDYLLPSLRNNGANFFRTWMCVWNLPVAWSQVRHTERYSNSEAYFNESGIKRMDELVQMCDSLGLYFMVSIDAHGALIPDGEWKYNNHNKVNGGPAATPQEFFTNEESKAMYRNRLRYLIARWGYSSSIAAWEFFNEIDNAVFTPTPHDSVLIDHTIITQWHDEMSTYLKRHDPYHHIVTTSISHRDIEGMNALENIDLNQKHIYNRTHLIVPTLHRYSQQYKKPYVIGEFGYDWNWDNVKHEYGDGFDHDYRRGLWYGLFSPTPILPMSWWWEFFDERNMTPYFKNVRRISDLMLESGNGAFDTVSVSANSLETYAVKCGADYFLYALNQTENEVTTVIAIKLGHGSYKLKTFDPATGTMAEGVAVNGGRVQLPVEKFRVREERIFILTRAKATSTGTGFE